MFPLQQGNELCFNISSGSHQQNTISQDLIFDHPAELLLYSSTSQDVTLNHHNNSCVATKSMRRKSTSMFNINDENTAVCTSPKIGSNKKLIHRDIERRRRQEMATLYSSLRSLLPLEFIKGKRSISDHMNEAVNYIKFLKRRIKDLDAKKDKLKEEVNLRDVPFQTSIGNSSYSSKSPGVLIRPCLGGFEILFSSGSQDQRQGLTLSKVLAVLLDEEISVVKCLTSAVNERVYHTVRTEVKDPSCLNLSELQQKLTQS